MPAFELTSPDGKKYRVEGPEGSTADQAYGILQKQLGQSPDQATPWKRFTGALSHDLEMPAAEGMKMAGMKPWQSYRDYEEQTRGQPPSLARELGEGAGEIGKGLVSRTPIGGAVMGALEPADNAWDRTKNAAWGAAGMAGGNALGRATPGVKRGLDALAEAALGYYGGGHLGGLGGGLLGGAVGGVLGGSRLQHFAGVPGPGTILSHLLKRYPGLAAELGPWARPYVEQGWDKLNAPDQNQ
jgi:hypothetical protein